MDEETLMDGAPEEGAPMDAVFEKLTGEQREKALRIAHKYGISEGDVTWVLVLLALDAQDSKEWAGQAAQAAGEAADRVRDEIRALPEIIKSAEMESANARLEVLVKTAGAKIAEMVANAEAQIRVQADKSGREIRILQAEADKAIAEAQKQASGQFTGEIKKAIANLANKITKEVLIGVFCGSAITFSILFLLKSIGVIK